MDSHLRGSSASGYGAVLVQIGLPLSAATKSGTTNLLTVTANQSDFPVLVQLKVVCKQAFDAGAGVEIQAVDSNGVITTLAPGILVADTTVESDYLAYGADKINVIYTAAGTPTEGTGAVFATYAGVGQLAPPPIV